MIALARASGFTITPTEDPSVVGFRMALEKEPEQEKSATTMRGAR